MFRANINVFEMFITGFWHVGLLVVADEEERYLVDINWREFLLRFPFKHSINCIINKTRIIMHRRAIGQMKIYEYSSG